MSEEKEGAEAPKRNVLSWTDVDALTAGIERYEKTSFWVIGHRGGTRLAVPKTTTGVSRAYFYGTYEQVPALPGIRTFTPEERKQLHKGGIVAEVDFELGLEEATAALASLIEVVRVAPAPAPRGEKKARQPKAAKAAIEPDPAPPADDEDAGR
jgi:hypothetical protein